MSRAIFRLFVTICTVFTTLLATVAVQLHAPPPALAASSYEKTSPFWVTDSTGRVTSFGSAGFYGDMRSAVLNKPVVGMTPTTSNKGYWLVASDGGIFSFGDAKFFGSTGNIKLNKPIVGMTSTPSSNGYWMTASDGGIFAYGDAQFHGSTGSIKLNKPIVGMAATPTNKGYWLVASDGGIFAFGDAQFYGSTGAIKLNRPITAMAPTPTGRGYWLVASDGGIFAFGDALFYGSPGGGSENSYSKIIATPDGHGYWLLRNGGDSIAYGNAGSFNRPVTGLMFTVSTPGDVAVQFALAQIGKAYIWGGNGPDGYDCSGLTSVSWKKSSVTLPRIANDQYNFGTRVPLDQLRAGDLLFWGPDRSNDRSIDHVAMYVGGGWAVNAGGTGTGVNLRNVPATSGWMWSFGVRPKA